MQTPQKQSNNVMLSDFQFTHSLPKALTLEKKATLFSSDSLPTPKKHNIFVPLKDRTLRKYEFKAVRNNRAKLMDWFLQIFHTFQNGWECYWMTIELLDSLIADFDYVTLENIHLVSMVACFIISKFIGRNAITVSHVVIGMAHRKYSQRQILYQQSKIVKLIFQRSNFQRNNFYSFMMEKYSQFPQKMLSQAMKMLTLAMMRPDISVDTMQVYTYKELIDYVMKAASNHKKIPVLEQIYEEMKDRFGVNNIVKHAPEIRFT